MPDPKFKVGDPVQRAEPRSYLFPGIVIGVAPKLDGKTVLYTVECIAPGVEGMAHEFTEKALEPRPQPQPAQDLVEAAAAQAIHTYCSRNMVMTYLDADEDCIGLAQAILREIEPHIAQREADGWERGMRDAAHICGSLAETTYDDADAFEAATGCEAEIVKQLRMHQRNRGKENGDA